MLDFYRGKRVLITGHTGFKGSWMCQVLCNAGARVYGYALEPPTNPSLYELCDLQEKMTSAVGDVRDLAHLQEVFNEACPEIVIHMAAQPIVRESYKNPVYTYDVNVMGTVNVLECVRNTESVKSFINVTTDKVYLNREWCWGYRESEELNGYDPYSNSKSCSELVTASYVNSFFKDRDIAVTTMRAGNVIGGGDFAADRIIPDSVRAAVKDEDIVVRNPYSTRPYQHVLEPVMAYLLVAKAQHENRELAGSYNVGPDDIDCRTTGELTTLFCEAWNSINGTDIKWINKYDGGPHEASFLKLDCSKIKSTFGWKPVWSLEHTMDKIVEWNRVYMDKGDISSCMDREIEEFISMAQWI
ncbi:MAG: CDP-glucose 4,6-dehydratase [Clostridium sp.]|nr:CDP-glucose 4,6-dehydratase [Clostridium sp.]